MLRRLLGWSRNFKYQVAICAIAKNETPYLAEWVDYHLKTGVTQFYIYDNDSDIPIKDTLRRYIDAGLVYVEEMPGKQMQRHSYKQCLAKHGKFCRWIAFIDVDEFIVPRNLSGNLPEFLKDYENFGGLGVNWLVFGSNGHRTRPESQILAYRRRFIKTAVINSHIKTIVQPRYVKAASQDPHHFIFKAGKYCVNENFLRIPASRFPNSTNKIQLNHYFLRSLEEFHQKIARGRADGGETRTIEDFHVWDREANLIQDETILEILEILKRKEAGSILTAADVHR